MQEFLSRSRGLDGWKALTCSAGRVFPIVSQSPPRGTGSSAVLPSDGNLCYRGVELRDAEESSAERASSRNCSAILLVVDMGV
jgi:hypothetical protein